MKTVVVVDDDADIALALERLLVAAGFHAAVFASAEALLASSSADAADFLLLDVRLSGLSGFDLRREMALRGLTPPVIFMTAQDNPASRAQARAAGAVAFFAKPFRGQPMLDAIRAVLEPG